MTTLKVILMDSTAVMHWMEGRSKYVVYFLFPVFSSVFVYFEAINMDIMRIFYRETFFILLTILIADLCRN
jgi:hypothetical protein